MGNGELDEYLEALQREECYRVDAVVKESPFELTQRVSFVGANGAERGPYIRKFIKREAGMGAIYERLYMAQRTGKRFKHLPHILECYVHDDYLAVVMEYVHGETFQELVYREDPSMNLAANVFPMLCDAVSELHEEFDPPVIHRDLKPSNIILSGANLTVIDFGIAREFKDGAEADTAHFGTRSFAPPEQFGFGQTTVRSDVYALGMLLYYCLTETIPESNDRSNWFLDQRVPKKLRGVIAKATALDPHQRYESAAELKAAFLSACDEKGPCGQEADSAFRENVAHVEEADRGLSSLPQNESVSQQTKAPQVIGRIWNAVVIAAFVGLSAYFVYALIVALFIDPSRLIAPPAKAVVTVVLGVLFFALLAFACLDKRRIRAHFPIIASLKTWQIWTLALIAYIVAYAHNRFF